MKWAVPRASRGPSGSPARSPSTGLNVGVAASTMTIEGAAIGATICARRILGGIVELAAWLALAIADMLRWTCACLTSLFDAADRPYTGIAFACILCTMLVHVASSSTAIVAAAGVSVEVDSTWLVGESPLPYRTDVANLVVPNPSPRWTYGGERNEPLQYMMDGERGVAGGGRRCFFVVHACHIHDSCACACRHHCE